MGGCLSFGLYAAVIAGLLRLGGTLGNTLAAAVALAGLCRLYPWYARRQRMRLLRLADVDGMSGSEFEEYVAWLLEAQGYAVEINGASGDLGVDLIAERGDACLAVQVKRAANPVSRRAVSDAVAGMDHYGCNAAMVVTNNVFSAGALELAESTECELVDREVLAEWIVAAQRGKSFGQDEPDLQD